MIIVALLIPLYWWMMPKRPEQMRKVDRGLLAREDGRDDTTWTHRPESWSASGR